MENEMMETVLTEILRDLKHSNTLNKENSSINEENKNMLISLEKKLENKSEMKSADNNKSIEEILSNGILSIRSMVKKPPEKVRREFRILLFPEHNTKEYYKVVFGRIIFWLVILVIAKYMYLLGSEWITNEYENQKYKKAWQNLYQQVEKSDQKIMKKILDNNLHADGK